MDGKRIKAFYANATAWSFDGDAEPHIVAARERQAAEFDAWLDRERAEARREGKAEAWDEAVDECYALGSLYDYDRDEAHVRNPYRQEVDR